MKLLIDNEISIMDTYDHSFTTEEYEEQISQWECLYNEFLKFGVATKLVIYDDPDDVGIKLTIMEQKLVLPEHQMNSVLKRLEWICDFHISYVSVCDSCDLTLQLVAKSVNRLIDNSITT